MISVLDPEEEWMARSGRRPGSAYTPNIQLLPPPVAAPVPERIGLPPAPYNLDMHRGQNMALGFDAWKGVLTPERAASVDAVIAASPDPDLTKAIMTNQAFMAGKTGVSENVINRDYDKLRDSYAAQNKWDDAIGDDRAFHKHVVEVATKDKDEQEMTFGSTAESPEAAKQRADSIYGKAYEYGLKLPANDDGSYALKAWQQEVTKLRTQPGFRVENIDAYYAHFTAFLEQGQKDGRQADKVAAAANEILKGKSYTTAQLAGEENAVDAVAGFMARVPENIRELALDRLSEGPKGEDKEGIVMGMAKGVERVAVGIAQNVDAQLDSIAKDMDIMMGSPESGMTRLVSRQAMRQRVQSINDGVAHPINKDTILRKILIGGAESIPVMAAAAIPGAGPVVMVASYAKESELKMIADGTPREKARGLSWISGGAKAGMDMLQLRIFTKFPGMGNLLGKLSGSKVAAGVVTGAGIVAGETIIELGQDNVVDYAVTKTASLFDNTIYAKPWNDVVHEMFDTVGETALVMIPWALIGVGAATAHDIKGASRLVRNEEAMTILGYSAESIAKVRAATDADAVKVFRQEWSKRTPRTKGDSKAKSIGEGAQFAGEEMVPRGTESAAAIPLPRGMPAETPDSAMPADSAESEEAAFPMHLDDDGWYVMDGEKRIDAGTVEPALHIRERLGMAQSEAAAQGYIAILDALHKPGQVTTVTGAAVTAEKGGQTQTMTPGGEFLEGVKPAEAVAELNRELALMGVERGSIEGSNFVRDGVQSIVLNQSSKGALTVLHENVESLYKAGKLSADEVKRAAFIGFKLYETAKAGEETALRLQRISLGKATETEARETIVELIVTNEVSRRKDGSKSPLPAGALTAAMLGDAQARRALPKMTAFFRAVRAYFTAVFSTAARIAKARREGDIDIEALDQMTDKLLGLDPRRVEAQERQHARTVETEATETFSIGPAPESAAPVKWARAGSQDGMDGEMVLELFNVEHDDPFYQTTFAMPPGASDAQIQARAQEKFEEFDARRRETFSVGPAGLMDVLADKIAAKITDPKEKLEAYTRAHEKFRGMARSIRFNDSVAEAVTKAAIEKERVAMRAAGASAQEAQEWAAGELADLPKRQKGRETQDLQRFMAALDALIVVLPAEVRAKVGGFTRLAGIQTNQARADFIADRIEKIDKVYEEFLRKEYSERMATLIARANRTAMEAGKKPGSAIGPDAHYLINKMAEAMPLNETEVDALIAGLDSRVASGELTPEQEALAMRERELVNLAGDWKNNDAAQRAAAYDAAENTFDEGWLAWSRKVVARREARERMRTALISDTGKAGTDPEKDARADKDMGWRGKLKDVFLGLSSFDEAMRYVFGVESSTGRALVDRERVASNVKEDAIQEIGDAVADLFTGLAGSPFKGTDLQWDLAQKEIDAGKAGKLSQLQVIQATLMWRQADGQRHMEAFGYDQGWINAVESKLSDKAKAVREFLQAQYAAEYAPLNALYRERHGVNLPGHDNYAPLTVRPMQARSGEVVDPVTGQSMGASLLTPGSLRSRSRMAKAQPEFRDALQTYLGHVRQLEHWKAYYDLAIDLNAIVGNRNVQNSVEAAGGVQASKVLNGWKDLFAMGGNRDAGAFLALNQGLGRMSSRAAEMILFGRAGTLMIQSTQLGAALAEMPTGSYIKRLGMLFAGRLGWRDALHSPYIQRRFEAAPPIVRQAMDALAATEPNRIKHAARQMGRLIAGADALFTAGTYAIALDYHTTQGRKGGMTGAELDAYAHREAERATDRVAQPTRTGTRSLFENTTTSPLARAGWAFASEARQKIALAAWAVRSDPAQFARTIAVVWGAGGVAAAIIRAAWRDMRDDEDEELFDARNWSAKRLLAATLAGPLQGIPVFGDIVEAGINRTAGVYAPGGDIFSQGQQGVVGAKKLVTGKAETAEERLKAAKAMLFTLGLTNDTLAAATSLANVAEDGLKVVNNLNGD